MANGLNEETLFWMRLAAFAGLSEHVFRRNPAVVEDQLAGRTDLDPHFMLHTAEAEPRAACFHGQDDHVGSGVPEIRVTDHHVPGGHVAAGDEDLRTVDQVAAFHFPGMAGHLSVVHQLYFLHVGSGAGFGDGRGDQAGVAGPLPFGHQTAEPVDHPEVPGPENGGDGQVVNADQV